MSMMTVFRRPPRLPLARELNRMGASARSQTGSVLGRVNRPAQRSAKCMKPCPAQLTEDDGVDAVKLLEDHEDDSNHKLRPILPLHQVACSNNITKACAVLGISFPLDVLGFKWKVVLKGLVREADHRGS